jgi:head-tail adaptor
MPLIQAEGTALGSSNPTGDSVLTAALAERLTDVCDIQRLTGTDDGQGTQSEDWATLYANVPCNFLKPLTYTERVQAGMVTASIVFPAEFPVDTDLRATDRVIKDGYVFEVKNTSAGQSKVNVLTAYLVRVNRQSA